MPERTYDITIIFDDTRAGVSARVRTDSFTDVLEYTVMEVNRASREEGRALHKVEIKSGRSVRMFTARQFDRKTCALDGVLDFPEIVVVPFN